MGLVYNIAKAASLPFDLPSLSIFSYFVGDVVERMEKLGYAIHVCKIEPVPFDKGEHDETR